MSTAYIAVTSVAIAANGLSGVAALVHFKPQAMGSARVRKSAGASPQPCGSRQ